MSRLSPWKWILFGAALAAWTWQLWTFYLPRGIVDSLFLLREINPIVSDFRLKPWWIDLLGASILAFAALCAGGWLLERLRVEISDGLEHAFFSAGAGFAALILAASSLGLIAAFRPRSLRVLLILFALAAIPRAPREFRRLRDTLAGACRALAHEPLAILPLALAAVFTFFGLIAAAAPETSYDALVGYFPYTRLFLERGTFYLIELHRSNTPLYGIVFYALGIATHGEPAARMLNFLTLPGLLLGVAALARAIAPGSRTVAPALAVFWAVSCPALLGQATECLPDLLMAVFCLLALLAVLRYIESQDEARDIRWAALAGVFSGLAAGTKYAGLYWVILAGLAVLSRRLWRPTIVFSIVALAIFAPWLVRNWVHTGDPMHPSFQKYLAHPAIDLAEAKGQMADGMNYRRLPLTVSNILALPWLITMDGDHWQGTVGPVFLWALPLMLLGARRSPAWIATAISLPLFAFIWFIGPQWARYFIPGVPAAAALAAAGVVHERIPSWIRYPALAAGIVLGLVSLPPLNPTWIGGGTNSLASIPFETAYGPTTNDQYLRRSLPGYDAVKYLNAQPLPNSTTVITAPPFQLFAPWLSRMRVFDIWDNGHVVCADVRQKPANCYTITGRALRQNMDLAGVDVLVVRRDAVWAASRSALRLEDPFLRAHFRLLGYGGGAFHFLRSREGAEAGQLYINADLISRFATQDHMTADPANVHLTSVQTLGGDERWSLVFERPAELKFEVAFGRRPRLRFFAGWESGQAVDYGSRIVVEVDGKTVLLHHFTIEESSGWIDLSADLAPFSDKTVQLAIRTEPNEGSRSGRVVIADPVVYAEETEQPFRYELEEPAQWLFSTATTRNPVEVRFIPAEVHPGDTYVMEVPSLANSWIDLLIARDQGVPEPALHFRLLDAQGRTTIHLPADFMRMTVFVRGVRRSGPPSGTKTGEQLWLRAVGKIAIR